jgi:hypothetical protein
VLSLTSKGEGTKGQNFWRSIYLPLLLKNLIYFWERFVSYIHNLAKKMKNPEADFMNWEKKRGRATALTGQRIEK